MFKDKRARLVSSRPESLEARIAPAVLVSPTSITYTDIDGDAVTVTITKGTLAAEDFVFDSSFETAGNQQLLRVAFAADLLKNGTDLTFAVVQTGGGDGFVNVGFIDATGIDLGTVTLPGDLGRIEAGNGVTTTPAVAQLTVDSFGLKGLDTQGSSGSLVSNFRGPLTSLIVNGDVQQATLLVDGGLFGRDGKIGSIEITGDLIGGAAAKSGAIRAQGNIGTVHVGGDILGGDGEDSGQIFSRRNINTATVDGSVEAEQFTDGGKNSAQVFAGGDMGTVTVGGDVRGGEGEKSGQIAAAGKLTSVTVNQSVIGGMGFESGAIGSGGALSSVTIKGDLVGFEDKGPSSAGRVSGAVLSDSTIGTVLIEGDIQGGDGMQSGIIAAARTIASVTVNGSVFGGTGNISGSIGSKRGVGTVHVLGDVQGGRGDQSGEIVSKTGIANVTIDGSLIGGFGQQSGAIGSPGRIREVHVGVDVFGGVGDQSAWITSASRIDLVTIGGNLSTQPNSFRFSGIIESLSIGEVTIGGSLGGFGASVGLDPGFILGGSLGKLSITGAMMSNPNSLGGIDMRGIGSITVGQIIGVAGNPVKIAARNSLASLTVADDMTYASIVIGGGFDFVEVPANPDAQVGNISIGGTWLASSLVVGAFIGNDGIFGTDDDFFGPPGSPTVFSKIASITIDGQALGTTVTASATDRYAIIAQHVASMRVGANTIPLKSGPRNDNPILLDPVTADFFVRERPVSLA